MRCRSMFYTSLGRLLMVDLGEDEEWFHGFMLPLTGTSFFLLSNETPLSKKDFNSDFIYYLYLYNSQVLMALMH